MKDATPLKASLISILLSLFFFTLISGCSSDDVKFIDVIKFEDSNITYSNFSCQTDANIATITKYIHSCSFDVIDKNADQRSIIDIQYSYCPPVKPCYKEGSLTLTNFKSGELYHYEFGFEDYLVNRLSITHATFNFKATRTVYIERNHES